MKKEAASGRGGKTILKCKHWDLPLCHTGSFLGVTSGGKKKKKMDVQIRMNTLSVWYFHKLFKF